MRGIKFRVWDSYHNRIIADPNFNIIGGSDVINELFCDYPRIEFMQYTGLKDQNGKDIYEGDLVMDRTEYADLYDTEGLFKNNRVIIPLLVQWSKSEAGFWLVGDWDEEEFYYKYSDQIHDRRLEVIGNIYENLELLKGNL